MTSKNKRAHRDPAAESIFKEAHALLLCCMRHNLVSWHARLAWIFLSLAPLCDQATAREALGAAIVARGGQIKEIKKNAYRVRSQTTGPEWYTVRQTARGWSCRCPDHSTERRTESTSAPPGCCRAIRRPALRRPPARGATWWSCHPSKPSQGAASGAARPT